MKFNLERVKNGRSLELIGWTNGYMLVQFAGRPTQYVYGPSIPPEEKSKLLRSPFPDRLFETNIKQKYRCHRLPEVA